MIINNDNDNDKHNNYQRRTSDGGCTNMKNIIVNTNTHRHTVGGCKSCASRLDRFGIACLLIPESGKGVSKTKPPPCLRPHADRGQDENHTGTTSITTWKP